MGPYVDLNLHKWAARELLISRKNELDSEAKRLFRNAKSRAKRKKIPFRLTKRGMAVLMHRAGKNCEVTGIIFDRDRAIGNLRYAPFSASIDRVDSNRGYEFSNCRMAIAVLNMAKGEQSMQLFHTLALNYALARGAVLPEDLKQVFTKSMWEF